MATTKNKRSVRRAQPSRPRAHSINPTNKKSDRLFPGQLVLLERNLPHRRFVEFPVIKGKTIEKLEFFASRESHSFTIEFTDQTALGLEIEPGFTVNAEFQQREKDDIEVLAEWPPIESI